MDQDGSPQRFSSDEMRRILEAATTPESSRPTPRTDPEGFTLAEIQEIAGEVGIDPARIERASRALARRVPLEARVSLGTYQLERRFQRLLSPEEMRFVVQEADRYFRVEGQIRQTPGYLEWHSPEARAFVGMVNESGHTRVRVILDGAAHSILGGAALSAVGVFLMLGLFSEFGGLVGTLGAAAVAAVTGRVLMGFRKWRRASTVRRIEDLIKLMTEGPISRGPTDGS